MFLPLQTWDSFLTAEEEFLLCVEVHRRNHREACGPEPVARMTEDGLDLFCTGSECKYLMTRGQTVILVFKKSDCEFLDGLPPIQQWGRLNLEGFCVF